MTYQPTKLSSGQTVSVPTTPPARLDSLHSLALSMTVALRYLKGRSGQTAQPRPQRVAQPAAS